MRKYWIYSVFILLQLVSQVGYAQTMPFRSFGLADGLFDEKCYDVVQDSMGFVWLGTNSGLIRFDGAEFKSYPIEGVKQLDVYRLTLQNDRLWILTAADGFFILENDSIFKPQKIAAIDTIKAFSKEPFASINIDEHNNLHIGFVSEDMLFRFVKISPELDLDVDFKLANKGQWGYVKCFNNGEVCFSKAAVSKPNEDILIEQNGELDTLQIDRDQHGNYHIWGDLVSSPSLKAKAVTQLYSVHVIDGKDIFKYQPKGIIQPGATFFENDTTLWVGMRRGPTLQIKWQRGKLKQAEVNEYFNLYDVSNYFKNKRGSFIITSASRGMFYTPNTSISKLNLADDANANSMVIHKGQLYILTEQGGVFFLDKKDLELQNINQIDLPAECIYSSGQNLYVATFLPGVQYIRKKDLALINYQGKGEVVELDDCVWQVDHKGIRYYNGKGERTVVKTFSKRVYGIECNQFGNGISLNNNQLTFFRLDTLGVDFVKDTTIFYYTDLASDQLGNFYVVSDSFELFEVNGMGKRKFLLKNEELFKQKILQIKRFEGSLLILFQNALVQFNTKDASIKLLPRYSGIFNGVFKKFETINDVLYILDDNSVYEIKQPFIDFNKSQYAPVLQLNGKLSPVKGTITRPHGQNSLYLYNSTFNYTRSPFLTNQLEVTSGGRVTTHDFRGSQVFLPDMAYGEHQVKTYMLNTITGEKTHHSKLQIVIQKPFWLQLKFQLSVFFVLIVVLVMFITIRYRSKLKQEKLQNQLQLLRSEAISAQLRPHFIFNALGGIQYLINSEETELAEDYLTQFARLLRLVLENSSNHWYALASEIEVIKNYLSLEDLRFEKSTELTIVNNTEYSVESIQIPPLVLQTLVENSIIHGLSNVSYKGKIKLEISESNSGCLKVEVKDNGVGFGNSFNQKATHKRSLGLKMIEERLKVLSKMNGTKASVFYGNSKQNDAFNARVELNFQLKLKTKQ